MHSDRHTCFFLFSLIYLEMSLFPIIFWYHCRFLCMESTSYVLPFRMVFFDLVTTGWIFYTSLCENSINKKTALDQVLFSYANTIY